MTKRIFLCICFAFVSAAAADNSRTVPEEHYVITANRVDSPVNTVASSISVILAKEIENKADKSVLEAIDGTPGLDVVQSGGQGGNAAVFIRGANSEHTLVLIDGLEANNPMTPTRIFNFANLSTDNIERIEILRGSQSTLYGSDALGGVINIITKRGRGKPSGFLEFEGGSYQSFIERAGLSGGTEFGNYSLGVSRKDVDGFSSASESLGNGEDDGYQNTSFSGRFGLTPSDIFESDVLVRLDRARTELDNSGGPFGDDPNRILQNEDAYLRAEGRLNLLQDKIKPKFGVSYTNQFFEDNNDPDSEHPFDVLRSDYRGRLLKFDLQNQVTVNKNLDLLLGLETEEERGRSNYFSDGEFGPYEDDLAEQSARTSGYFVQTVISLWDSFTTTVGGRLDDHSQFGSKGTYRVAPSYLFSSIGTRIFGTLGSGFKAPSLSQLYSSYGDENLNPEESTSFDAGIEQKIFGDMGSLSATYFSTDFDNLISFNPDTFKSENIAEARSRGVELLAKGRVGDRVELGLGYTYTDAEDTKLDEPLLRRARNKGSLNVAYKLSETLSTNVELLVVGKRFDNNFDTFPASREVLGSYSVLNLNARYQLSKTLELFAKVENLFDREYENVFGYGTSGLAGYGGIRVRL